MTLHLLPSSVSRWVRYRGTRSARVQNEREWKPNACLSRPLTSEQPKAAAVAQSEHQMDAQRILEYLLGITCGTGYSHSRLHEHYSAANHGNDFVLACLTYKSGWGCHCTYGRHRSSREGTLVATSLALATILLPLFASSPSSPVDILWKGHAGCLRSL
jgi:hypothetical protein